MKRSKTKQTKWEKFQKSAKCKNIHSSPMSNLSWFNFKNKGNFLKVHNMCLKAECRAQKQVTFTPNHFELEGAGFKNARKIFLNVVKKHGKRFLSQQ